MSGYLERLVRTVTQPHESVHPRTGSIFAPYRNEPESPLQSWEEDEAATHSATRSDSPATEGPADRLEAGRTNQPDSIYTPLLANIAAIEPGRTFEPAARPLDADLPLPVAPATSRALRSNDKSHFDQAEQEVELPQQATAPRREAAVEAQTLAVARRRQRALIKPQRAADPSTNIAAATNLRSEARAPRAEPQADDIQIHIDRIEVTAVQPPAARAAQVPDKALSLDAYLARRHGSAK